MTILWPVNRLRPQNIAFDIASRNLAAPPSVSGATQVVSSDAGIWRATFGSVIVKSRNEVLAWRAIDVLLEGRLGAILLPMCAGYQPRPDDAAELGLYDSIPHSDDAFFSDDSGYQGRVINVHAAAPAAARAVSMSVTVVVAGTIEPGQHFSIGERLYRIRSFNSDTGTMTFRPPLREAVTTGTALNFDSPVGKFRLATDDGMNLELALRRFGSPSVSFVEYL
jgi:hypothetical protein